MAAFKEIFNADGARRIGAAIGRAWPDFDEAGFVAAAVPRLPGLELKARVEALTEELAARLPAFPEAAPLLAASLGEPHPAAGTTYRPEAEAAADPGLVGMMCWPVSRYVGRFGVEHPDVALPLLAQITRRFTAEFAVRPFLVQHRDQTLAYLRSLTTSDDQHLRRWVSEGTRPRLPWGDRLAEFVADPSPGLELLELLKDDPSEYVRRSVANHLGDVAKDNLEFMLTLCERWAAESDAADRTWVVRHACRHPVKQGNPRALALLGFTVPPRIRVEGVRVENATLSPGGKQLLHATVTSESAQPQRLGVDAVLFRPGARGERSKVFKGKKLTLAPGASADVVLQAKIAAAKHEAHYGGTHRLCVQVNGERFGDAPFDVTG